MKYRDREMNNYYFILRGFICPSLEYLIRPLSMNIISILVDNRTCNFIILWRMKREILQSVNQRCCHLHTDSGG